MEEAHIVEITLVMHLEEVERDDYEPNVKFFSPGCSNARFLCFIDDYKVDSRVSHDRDLRPAYSGRLLGVGDYLQ